MQSNENQINEKDTLKYVPVSNPAVCDGLGQGQLKIWMEHSTIIIKTKMGVAGLMFEPHPPNFEDVQMIF